MYLLGGNTTNLMTLTEGANSYCEYNVGCAHTLTLTAVTLSSKGATACPWQVPTMAQCEQMSFCSVPQNQLSPDSCSTQSSSSPEKIPDSVSVVVVVVAMVESPALCWFFTPPSNTVDIDSSQSIRPVFTVSSGSVEEDVST